MNMEGDSVTLDPGLTKPFNHIQWRFGGSIIAETDGNEASYTNDERFRDRLKLDDETGSLTINNMRITDTGLYHLEIKHNTEISNKTFSVTVQGSFYPDPDLSPGSFYPGLSLGALAAIVVAPLVLSAAAAAVSAAISYCRKISKRRRQNDKEKRKSTDSGQSDL